MLENSTATCKQSRSLLECIEGNFLIQSKDSSTRGEVLLDLLLINIDKRIRDVRIDVTLGCSDCALVEFTILRGRVRTLNFRRTNFQLFREKIGTPGKLPSGTKELNRADSSLRMFFLECKSSRFLHVRNQTRMTGDSMVQ